MDKIALGKKRDEGRSFYFKLLSEQQLKALSTSNPEKGAASLRNEAETAAKKSFQKALEKWCSVDAEEFAKWFENRADDEESRRTMTMPTSRKSICGTIGRECR